MRSLKLHLHLIWSKNVLYIILLFINAVLYFGYVSVVNPENFKEVNTLEVLKNICKKKAREGHHQNCLKIKAFSSF